MTPPRIRGPVVEVDRALACLVLAQAAGIGWMVVDRVFLIGPALVGLAAGIVYAGVVRAGTLGSGSRQFGWAHRVTLARGLLMLSLVPFLLTPAPDDWRPALMASLALALDGVDGAIARRSGRASAFGARFDMETDAMGVLLLSLLVWAEGRVGGWVLLSGALRYLFGAAGWCWPWLGRPVPPSILRKTICVIQVAALILALMPGLDPPWPLWVTGVALALLLGSFGRDFVWLLRERNMAQSPAAPYLSSKRGV